MQYMSSLKCGISPSHPVINDASEALIATREQATIQATSKPSLLLAMCQTHGLVFVTNGFLKFIADLLNFVGPQILK